MDWHNDPFGSSKRAQAITQDRGIMNDPLTKWYNPNYGSFVQPQTPYEAERMELDRRYGMHPSYQGQLASLNARYGIKGGSSRKKRVSKKNKKSKKHVRSRKSTNSKIPRKTKKTTKVRK